MVVRTVVDGNHLSDDDVVSICLPVMRPFLRRGKGEQNVIYFFSFFVLI